MTPKGKSVSEPGNTSIDEECIRPYFSESDWEELSSYDKINICNKKRNYERMLEAGLTPKKPDFMRKEEEEEEEAAAEKTRKELIKQKCQSREAPNATKSEGTQQASIRCSSRLLRSKVRLEEDDENTLCSARKVACRHCGRVFLGTQYLRQHYCTAPACAKAVARHLDADKAAAHEKLRRIETPKSSQELQPQRLEQRLTRKHRRKLAEQLQRQKEAWHDQNDLCHAENAIEAASRYGDSYKCALCDVKFRRASLLRAHLAKAHSRSLATSEAHSTCGSCRATFASSDQLRTHLRMTHIALKRFLCRKCKFISHSWKSMEAHAKKHGRLHQ